LKELIRKIFFVPENKKVEYTLKDFQQKRVIWHRRDEYGGTSGLVTLEDRLKKNYRKRSMMNSMIEDDFFFQEITTEVPTFSKERFPPNDFCKRLELDYQIFDMSK